MSDEESWYWAWVAWMTSRAALADISREEWGKTKSARQRQTHLMWQTKHLIEHDQAVHLQNPFGDKHGFL